MKLKGNRLKFISQINRDGKGVTGVKYPMHWANTEFNITSLSISNSTYIASEFNSFVVKIKPLRLKLINKA